MSLLCSFDIIGRTLLYVFSRILKFRWFWNLIYLTGVTPLCMNVLMAWCEIYLYITYKLLLVGKRLLCRHPFNESKRAYIVTKEVEELLKCYRPGISGWSFNWPLLFFFFLVELFLLPCILIIIHIFDAWLSSQSNTNMLGVD